MLCVVNKRFRAFCLGLAVLPFLSASTLAAELDTAGGPDALIAEMEQAALEMESKPRGETGRTARVKEIWGRIETLGE